MLNDGSEEEEQIVSSPKIDDPVRGRQAFQNLPEVALKPEVTLGKYKGCEVQRSTLS